MCQNHSQSAQQTGNCGGNHNYQSNTQTKHLANQQVLDMVISRASLATSLVLVNRLQLSEVTSANKVVSDSVSQTTSGSEVAPQRVKQLQKG